MAVKMLNRKDYPFTSRLQSANVKRVEKLSSPAITDAVSRVLSRPLSRRSGSRFKANGKLRRKAVKKSKDNRETLLGRNHSAVCNLHLE